MLRVCGSFSVVRGLLSGDLPPELEVGLPLPPAVLGFPCVVGGVESLDLSLTEDCWVFHFSFHSTSMQKMLYRSTRNLLNPFPMTEHAKMVKALAKSGEAIKEEMTPVDAHLFHMAAGISGEAGELLDAIKKAVIYRKELDHTNVVEELGDLEFFMEGLRQGLGITREETLTANIDKLSVRYSGGYSDAAAKARADKD